VEESVKQQIRVDEHTGYGYLFWLTETVDKAGHQVSVYEANGYGGQHIRVIPEWDLVVVVTSDPDSRDGSDSAELINQYVIPAIQP
jgi:CubicO group peptidase (beta-lactamase class C family)